MKAHTEQEFSAFMKQLLETNANLGFYTDFEKCYGNVSKIAIRLNILNYLLGKENIESAVHDIWEENPAAFSVLGILIAVRDKDKKKAIGDDGATHLIVDYFKTESGVIEYIKETGLEKVFSSKRITNLVDYVFGVEVGLDTNARKNRSGNIMADMVASILDSAGIAYEQEVYAEKYPAIQKALGADTKRFDFVVKTPSKIYLMEVNFYSGGGSKLNEIARSYTEIAPRVNGCAGFEFVWVTDGMGWKNAKTKLEEAFYTIPQIYNLTTFREFVKQIAQ